MSPAGANASNAHENVVGGMVQTHMAWELLHIIRLVLQTAIPVEGSLCPGPGCVPGAGF